MDKETIKKWMEENQSRIGLKEPEISDLKSGESNHNFIIKSGDRKCVLRVSRDVSREDRLKNEAEKLEFLEYQETGYVPEKIFFEETDQIGTVLIETFVGNENLNSEKMNDERLKSLASNIAEIHSTSISEYNNFFGRNEKMTANLKDIFRQDFKDWSERPYREYMEEAGSVDSRIEKFFKKQKKLLDSVPEIEVSRGLVHGDLGFNIRAAGNQVFIVDWEFCRIDYPGNEILYCFEHEDLGPHQREVFLEEYQRHRELDKAFQRVREIYPGFLAFNDAVWAAKRIEIEPEEKDKHKERLEEKIEKLEDFYRDKKF
jgi:fructosamine-3-kinase